MDNPPSLYLNKKVLLEGYGASPKKNQVAVLLITVTLKDGSTPFIKEDPENPYTFLIGTPAAPKGIEDCVLNMKLGEICTIDVEAKNSFVQDVP